VTQIIREYPFVTDVPCVRADSPELNNTLVFTYGYYLRIGCAFEISDFRYSPDIFYNMFTLHEELDQSLLRTVSRVSKNIIEYFGPAYIVPRPCLTRPAGKSVYVLTWLCDFNLLAPVDTDIIKGFLP
jgi:hypothetical protein